MGYPANYNFTVSQNETVQYTFTWKTGDPEVPVNLTNYTARMQLKSNLNSPALLTLTNVSGITLSADGEIAITIPYLIMATLPAGQLIYDLELLTGSTMTPLLAGEFRIRAEVTT